MNMHAHPYIQAPTHTHACTYIHIVWYSILCLSYTLQSHRHCKLFQYSFAHLHSWPQLTVILASINRWWTNTPRFTCAVNTNINTNLLPMSESELVKKYWTSKKWDGSVYWIDTTCSFALGIPQSISTLKKWAAKTFDVFTKFDCLVNSSINSSEAHLLTSECI